ncbi:MAG TPA: TMEM175 family protein [Thermoanaerobaculia bacterium]|nr:TMEM175 family protein [Thermoanaerobaculia bacterium]
MSPDPVSLLPARPHRPRGHEVTRLEAFSDAVFAFASTLLVVSLEVPHTYPELMANLKGFVAFGLSFTMLVLIWAAHNGFFRRYGLQDGRTVVLNSALLFVVLFYVYPLKFLFTVFVSQFIHLGAAAEGQGARLDRGELASLMMVYGLGFVAVFTCLALLYAHAWALREELGLDAAERIEASMWFRHYLIFVAVGLLSIALAAAGVGLRYGVPGFAYCLLGPFCWWNGEVAGRRKRALQSPGAA